MAYSDEIQSNVGEGLIPHKKDCRCTECLLELHEDQQYKDAHRIIELEKALGYVLAVAKFGVLAEGNLTGQQISYALRMGEEALKH